MVFVLWCFAHLSKHGDPDHATLDEEISHPIRRGFVHSPTLVERSGSNDKNALATRVRGHRCYSRSTEFTARQPTAGSCLDQILQRRSRQIRNRVPLFAEVRADLLSLRVGDSAACKN